MKNLILIVGGSGSVGSEISKILTKAGHAVRTTTSKTPNSATQVKVNLLTGEGLTQAFEGVERAFFLSPAGYADQYQTLSPLIQEAKRRGLKKVVLMTAMGANAVETAPMRRAELDLEKSGLAYNIIRPNWFLQNFHTFWVHGINTQGQILVPGGEAKVSFIDTRDIAAVAAKLLVDDSRNNRDFDLTGGEAVTHAEVAAALSHATGKKVGYTSVDPVPFKAGLLQAGLPEDYSDFLLMIFGFLREGYSARVTSSVSDILGRQPIRLEQYAQDFRQAWK